MAGLGVSRSLMLTRCEGSCWAGVPLTWSGRGCRPVYPAAAGLLTVPVVAQSSAWMLLLQLRYWL